MREIDPGDRELARWREAYARRERTEAGVCPPVERLASLVLGELRGDERDALSDHVVACANCAAATRELIELHEATRRELVPPARRRVFLWGAAVAAVVVLAVAVPLLVERPSPEPSSTRGGASAVRELEPPNRAVLAVPPARLAWPAEPGATRYHVSLFDAESTSIWESDPVAEPAAEIPEAVRATLGRGGEFAWRVTSVVGIERRSSELHRFRVAP